MSCPCNASALRLFARGLVQVHRLEPGMPFALPVRGAPGVRSAGALASQRRSLHASQALSDAENPAPTNSEPDNQPVATAEKPSAESTTPREPVNGTPSDRTKTHEECMAEARGKAAWRFKQQGFDWKAFRSKDPAVRAKADFSNFDWKNWQGKKHGTKRLSKLVDNLEAARAEDRAAVGISPRGNEKAGFRNQRKRQDSPSTIARYNDIPEDGATTSLKKADWRIQKEAMKAKFPEGWKPHKRLSPDALAGIRALNAQFPDVYTTQTLASKFAVSPEAIRRILRSKWVPSSQEDEDRQQRWHRRGVSVWERKAELGIKPPKRWRDEGIAREPAYHERKAAARIGREQQVRKERDAYMRSFAKSQRGREEDDTTVKRGGNDRRHADGAGTADKPWRRTGSARSAEPSKPRETRTEPDGDVFDQALASQRRD
ncbi:hypothetical protein V2A60_006507 [Cordyceps javanica]